MNARIAAEEASSGFAAPSRPDPQSHCPAPPARAFDRSAGGRGAGPGGPLRQPGRRGGMFAS
jgi:hypothetical protein